MSTPVLLPPSPVELLDASSLYFKIADPCPLFQDRWPPLFFFKPPPVPPWEGPALRPQAYLTATWKIKKDMERLTWFGMWQHKALSNLPGLSRAGSMRSGRLVAPSTYTPIEKGKKETQKLLLYRAIQNCLYFSQNEIRGCPFLEVFSDMKMSKTLHIVVRSSLPSSCSADLMWIALCQFTWILS